jgi:hypothetical protein
VYWVPACAGMTSEGKATSGLLIAQHSSFPRHRPVITAAALEECLAGDRPSLVDAGALDLHGTARSTIVAGDDGPTFRDLSPQAGRNARGYFDAADGSVAVTLAEQTLLRVSMPWWLAWLASALDLTNCSQPTELVSGSVWDIGDLWISGRRKIPVLFARRLRRDNTHQALLAALKKRAGRSGGLILTSSRNTLRLTESAPPFTVTSIFGMLTNDADNFAVDPAIVVSPYLPASMPFPSTEPLYLSTDGKRLLIKGVVEIDFASDKHVAIVQLIVAAHRAGQRVRARDVLNKVDSAATTFRQAFGPKKWAELKPYLKSRNGLWDFDL